MDVSGIREDFPTLKKGDHVYLDSACQSLKPESVIDSMLSYYREYPACGGRSVHSMATKVSMRVDGAREKIARFFSSKDPNEFVFTKNCTESLNMIAKGLKFKRGDIIVTGDAEHNSNHIPWIGLMETAGIKRRFARTSVRGEFDMEAFKETMDRNVKMVSISHTSNVTGVTVPLKEIVEIAHDHGALVLADGAQAAPHVPVSLPDLDVDFYAASGHKMLGPSGVGILYGKMELLKGLEPLISGGGTVGLATYDSIKLSPPPERFEAGLLNYSGIIGMGAAVDYLQKIGMKNIHEHETHLQKVLQKEIADLGLDIVGPEDPAKRGGVFSFNIKGLESHDVAMMLDTKGIMIRSGMHCAHPFFVSRNIHGCARASVYLYNNDAEMVKFADSLRKVIETFA
jgi:Selenocysteine lyase